MMSLTVGICAYNEEWNIGSLLDNILAEQSLPKDAEVIVVCSGQTDNTAKIVSKISKKDSRVHLIQELTRRGKASAVNSILSKARGQNIIFVSADVMPRHGCFTELVRTVVADGGIGIACGGAVPVERGGLLLRTIVDTLWSLHNHQLKWQSDAGTLTHATDVFCIRNGIIDKIPPDTINDDSYIAVKTKALGYAIRFVPMSVAS
jgi:glycosyltransferase involved in cell wall biosynthesis